MIKNIYMATAAAVHFTFYGEWRRLAGGGPPSRPQGGRPQLQACSTCETFVQIRCFIGLRKDELYGHGELAASQTSCFSLNYWDKSGQILAIELRSSITVKICSEQVQNPAVFSMRACLLCGLVWPVSSFITTAGLSQRPYIAALPSIIFHNTVSDTERCLTSCT